MKKEQYAETSACDKSEIDERTQQNKRTELLNGFCFKQKSDNTKQQKNNTQPYNGLCIVCFRQANDYQERAHGNGGYPHRYLTEVVS